MRFGTVERLVSEDGSLELAIAVQRALLAAVVHDYFLIHGCGARRYLPDLPLILVVRLLERIASKHLR